MDAALVCRCLYCRDWTRVFVRTSPHGMVCRGESTTLSTCLGHIDGRPHLIFAQRTHDARSRSSRRDGDGDDDGQYETSGRRDYRRTAIV